MTKDNFPRLEIPEDLRRRMVEVARRFRKAPTPSEAVLWRALRGKRLEGIKFRRQQPIGPFVVDFFSPVYRLIVEIDGPIHAFQVEADQERQELLEMLGLRFVRISAELVENDLDEALDRIRSAIQANLPPHPPTPSPTRGEGEQEHSRVTGLAPTKGKGSKLCKRSLLSLSRRGDEASEHLSPPSPLVGEGGRGVEGEPLEITH